MKKELLKHKFAYLLLSIGLSLFVVAFLGLWPNRMAQRLSILAISLFYVFWGTVTHVKTQTFTWRVFAEYVGVAAVAGMLLLFITL